MHSKYMRLVLCEKMANLGIEVQESLVTVDIIKGCKARDEAIDHHWMTPQHATLSHEDPIRGWATHEYLI